MITGLQFENMKISKIAFVHGLALMTFFLLSGQNTEETDTWDNELYLGNKVSAGFGNWRTSGELQVRLADDMQALDQWFIEFIASYLQWKNWELAPDYRLTIKPDQIENRPGFSVIRKDIFGKEEGKKHQLVNQVKWQADIGSGFFNNGLRYAVFYNLVLNDKFVPNLGAGVFYRWSDNFTGVQFIRAGVGLSYFIDVKHSVGVSYYLGISDPGGNTSYQGIPVIQLIININKNFKYVPAKYIEF